jgi:hypothetical protein
MIRTHGSALAGWAEALRRAGYPGEVLLADQDGAAGAVIDAVALRSKNRPFVFGPSLEVARAMVAIRVAHALVDRPVDLRRTLLDQLAAGRLNVDNAPIANLTSHVPGKIETLKTIAALASGLIFRSATEGEAFARICGDVGTPRSLLPGDPPAPPVLPPAARDAIVVYAPSEPVEHLALIAAALADLRVPAIVVAARAQPIAGTNVRVVDPSAAPAALARARLVVEGSATDPLPLLALGQLDVPVAVASTTGSLEYRPHAAVFEPWSRASILDAVVRGLGLPPASLRPPAAVPPALVADEPADGPLVSVVVITYNRRDLVPRAVASVRAQTYRNIEIIVVNDGTDPIADLFAAAPDLRLIDNPVNLGLGGTRNAGAVHARGRYLAFLDDDDEFFPDHIARLVAALERTGFDLANAASLTRFARADATGAYRLAGYSVESMRTYALNELLVTNASTPVTLMFRRTAFERAGGFDEGRTGLEDYMLCLAIALTADVTSVQRVTSIYARRDDGSNMIVYTGARHADYLEAIYARHPVPARELVTDLRRQTIEVVRRNGGPPIPKPPLEIDAPLPPPMAPASTDVAT